MNNEYHRSKNISDLEIVTSEIKFLFSEPFSYTNEKAFLNGILTISDDKYVPTDNDKLFFLPGTTVPRIKLKDLATNRGIKSTRKIEDANAIFASRRSLDKLTENVWLYSFKTEDFKSFVTGIKPFMEDYDYEKIETALEFYTEDTILSDHNGNRLMTDENLISFRIDNNPDMDSGSNRFLKIQDGKEDLCKSLLAGNLAKIYDETTILEHVNGDKAVTINSEVYNNLSMMFDSTDTDNHILAMEIMANSNYTDSLLFLQMLFMNYNYHMESLKEKNHVNFKSLLAYLNKSSRDMNSTMDTVMTSLRDNGKLTEQNIETLLTYEAKNKLSISGSYSYFKIKSITLDPEYLKELNLNYVFETQKDIDIVIEEKEEEVLEQVSELNNIEELVEEMITNIETVEETPPTMQDTYDLVEEQQTEEFGETTEESEMYLGEVEEIPANELIEMFEDKVIEEAEEEEVTPIVKAKDTKPFSPENDMPVYDEDQIAERIKEDEDAIAKVCDEPSIQLESDDMNSFPEVTDEEEVEVVENIEGEGYGI